MLKKFGLLRLSRIENHRCIYAFLLLHAGMAVIPIRSVLFDGKAIGERGSGFHPREAHAGHAVDLRGRSSPCQWIELTSFSRLITRNVTSWPYRKRLRGPGRVPLTVMAIPALLSTWR